MDDKEKVVALAKEVAMWKKYNQTLIAEDVLNMILDNEMLTKAEMKEIMEKTNHHPRLPNKHFPLVIDEEPVYTYSYSDPYTI